MVCQICQKAGKGERNLPFLLSEFLLSIVQPKLHLQWLTEWLFRGRLPKYLIASHCPRRWIASSVGDILCLNNAAVRQWHKKETKLIKMRGTPSETGNSMQIIKCNYIMCLCVVATLRVYFSVCTKFCACVSNYVLIADSSHSYKPNMVENKARQPAASI